MRVCLKSCLHMSLGLIFCYQYIICILFNVCCFNYQYLFKLVLAQVTETFTHCLLKSDRCLWSGAGEEGKRRATLTLSCLEFSGCCLQGLTSVLTIRGQSGVTGIFLCPVSPNCSQHDCKTHTTKTLWSVFICTELPNDLFDLVTSSDPYIITISFPSAPIFELILLVLCFGVYYRLFFWRPASPSRAF